MIIHDLLSNINVNEFVFLKPHHDGVEIISYEKTCGYEITRRLVALGFSDVVGGTQVVNTGNRIFACEDCQYRNNGVDATPMLGYTGYMMIPGMDRQGYRDDKEIARLTFAKDARNSGYLLRPAQYLPERGRY